MLTMMFTKNNFDDIIELVSLYNIERKHLKIFVFIFRGMELYKVNSMIIYHQ